MIEAKDVSLRYKNGTLALKDISLNIKVGELVYIMGPSGSGKTSLLKILLGVEYPTTGSLQVFGLPVVKDRSRKIRKARKKIGPVFQEFKLIPGRTAMENVMLGMRFLGISPSQMKKNAMNALIKVGLEDKIFSLVENLSCGESQRVNIARAVARKPSLILADEPTGNLDHANALNIMNLLASFKDENTTVIITTHATHLLEGQMDATFIQVDSGYISVERRVKGNEKHSL